MDPAGKAAANPANPESWNLYAYVMNQPLRLVDPSGLLAGEDQQRRWIKPSRSALPLLIARGQHCTLTGLHSNATSPPKLVPLAIPTSIAGCITFTRCESDNAPPIPA